MIYSKTEVDREPYANSSPIKGPASIDLTRGCKNKRKFARLVVTTNDGVSNTPHTLPCFLLCIAMKHYKFHFKTKQTELLPYSS